MVDGQKNISADAVKIGIEDKFHYVISDSYIGKKSKTDDQFIQTQKIKSIL